MFTYGPGRVPPPLHLGVPSALIAGSFPPSGVINPTRQGKRLYIGGLKDETTEDQLEKFFNDLMHEHKIAADMPGEPVTEVSINKEKSFAFVEVRGSVSEIPFMLISVAPYGGRSDCSHAVRRCHVR